MPFVRTLEEAEQVVELLAANGLKRGENGLKVIMMCELPTNALLADRFLEYFDGFSIGSNDMTQLTLGLDRDSAIVGKLFDERDEAVKALLEMAISACRKPASTSASAARARRTTPTSRGGWSSRASRACRSIPTATVWTGHSLSRTSSFSGARFGARTALTTDDAVEIRLAVRRLPVQVRQMVAKYTACCPVPAPISSALPGLVNHWRNT